MTRIILFISRAKITLDRIAVFGHDGFMATTTYKLFGKNHKATVTACTPVSDDPDYPSRYWLWTLRFETPIKMYDGSMMYQTYVRRFTPAAGVA